MENEILQDKSMAFIAAGICALAMSAAAWGLTKLWTSLIETVGRNPQVKKDVTLFGFIGMGSIESIALYILVIAILMIL
ncbi:MAG: F0F1 ATP synthase subunit C [Alphaproteobacteria bacterium]|jgi:F-type H+-transporting ATPase subunit c|nr:F0F1 ATP synthase subunit C [Alphaproteobacteria bacterium]MBR1903689.1 F0F1 ATP synthase subunit C [Alphaproteobacteria bacterium]